jgi:RNA polymerase sigma factor (sigma-70 family)
LASTSDRPAHSVTPPEVADGRLVARALAFEVAAVEELCERLLCVPRMATALNLRLNAGLRAEDLRDLTQDVLAIVWKKLSEYDGQVPLEAWVLGIVRLELMNVVRRLRRNADTLSDDLLDARAAAGAEPSHDRERLANALLRLKPEDSRIIRMHVFDELDFDEIAANQGLSITAVKSRYYRGLQWLRDNLEVAVPKERHERRA